MVNGIAGGLMATPIGAIAVVVGLNSPGLPQDLITTGLVFLFAPVLLLFLTAGFFRVLYFLGTPQTREVHRLLQGVTST